MGWAYTSPNFSFIASPKLPPGRGLQHQYFRLLLPRPCRFWSRQAIQPLAHALLRDLLFGRELVAVLEAPVGGLWLCSKLLSKARSRLKLPACPRSLAALGDRASATNKLSLSLSSIHADRRSHCLGICRPHSTRFPMTSGLTCTEFGTRS